MNSHRSLTRIASCLLLSIGVVSPALADFAPARLLDLPASGSDPEQIDYDALPRLEGTHAVISPASLNPTNKDVEQIDLHHINFQLHNYLAYYGGRFWCAWSHGPPIEDEPTQEVYYATSADGLTWSGPKSVTGTPEAPYAFIARGLWVRDGELLALAAHFKGKGAFGADKELELRAYVWDEDRGEWQFKQTLYDNAINNFPPQRLPSGDWIMTRRDARFNVSMLIGGRTALNDWEAFHVVNRGEVPGFNPDEPIFWALPDKSLFAVFRDNSASGRLYHSTSADEGRNWSKPVVTNFPNAGSKVYSMPTSRGYRVLVGNANPKVGRRQLHLSVSEDGRTFTRMALLAPPSPPPVGEVSRVWHKFAAGVASLQYPHVIEHDGHLLIAFSRNKKQIELLRVPLDAVDALREN